MYCCGLRIFVWSWNRIWPNPRISPPNSRQARLRGTVRRIYYHGATYDVEVVLESGSRVQVTEFFDDDSDNLYFKPGDAVSVGWHEGWEVVLPHE